MGAGAPRVRDDRGRPQPGWDGSPERPPTPSGPLSSPAAPGAAPGQTKPTGPPGKRSRKAKATQAQKLRNSAKGKVPKSALGEPGEELGVRLRGGGRPGGGGAGGRAEAAPGISGTPPCAGRGAGPGRTGVAETRRP